MAAQLMPPQGGLIFSVCPAQVYVGALCCNSQHQPSSMSHWSLPNECCRQPLQVSVADAQRMVKEGLTALTSASGGVAVEACGAVAQLTQLRRLRLAYPSTLADARLRRLSTLSRLTSLEVVSSGRDSDHTGGWLAALAAARVPLRRLRLCDGGVQAGELVLLARFIIHAGVSSLPAQICHAAGKGMPTWSCASV